jgi:phage terminase Nu1 subunit (DNA packaging protein)
MARKAAARPVEVPASATVSRDRLAEIFGVHANTVALWIKNGMPVASRKGRSSSIQIAAAIRWVRERDAAECERLLEAARSSPDLDALRARKLEAESRIAEAEADLVEGRQVPAADVMDKLSRVVVAIREGVLSLGPRAVQVGIIPPDQEDRLGDLGRDVLRELAKVDA